ncbi:MAG: apolipoprotein N-acyltransferase, partial [Alphaproteobacteria bacterium]|nr:apolipoprotein N-acyltransferase [Alphaproteobacteria bacterium]
WWFVPIAVPGLSALLAAFIAVPCMAAWYAAPGWRRALVLAGAWTLADIAREFALTGFPWNPWGSVWAFPGTIGNVFLQPLAWIGTPGLTFLTVLLAALPTLGRAGLIAGAGALACWAGLGAWRLDQPAPPPRDLSVVLVQGNVAEGEKLGEDDRDAIFDRYLKLTKAGVAEAGSGPKVVVWPESASPYLLQDIGLPAPYELEAAEQRRAIAQATNGGEPGPTTALVGSIRFPGDRYVPGERPRNSLIAVAGDGAVVGVYDKIHLVPGGEFQPSWLPLPVQLVPGGGFDSGTDRRTLHIPGLPPVGILICYEAIFPGQVVDRADRPDWLVNITNDAWFGDSTGPRQHLAAARMRAVEEGMPLVRAANTGISAAFDAHGRELRRLGLDRQGTIVAQLPAPLPPTPFGRFGLAIPALIATASVAIGALARRGMRSVG